MRQLIYVFALIVFVQLMANKAYAQCQPIYGGGTTCQPSSITLSKSVFDPQTNTFVHDMGVNDGQFRPGDVVTFQITATNTGQATQGSLEIIDTLPASITFSQGQGTYDATTNSVHMLLPSLAAGQSETITFNTKIDTATQLPSTQDTQCITNSASAYANNLLVAQDTAQFCIFHPVTATPAPTTTVPPSTGASPLALALFTTIGGTGTLLLRRIGKEYKYGIS